MTAKPGSGDKALVTVFDDLGTATAVIERLIESGFRREQIELVTDEVATEAPEVETPAVHETTLGAIADDASKWAGVGAGAGLIAGLLTPFPGLALGMAVMGGVTGAIVGGMGGAERAAEDDSVDLPDLDEYERLVKGGDQLVVVLGDHDEVMRAEAVVKNMRHVRSHIHLVHGREYHEHPAHRKQNPK